MLNEVCLELNNFFCNDEDRIIGEFTVTNGALVPPVSMQSGQYYRIVGSVFNDGVHKAGDSEDVLKDEEEFHGAIWLMRVPSDVITLSAEIDAWVSKYGGADGVVNSPYSSESFGGYSYTKRSGYGGYSGGSESGPTWQSVFAKRLAPYRRIRTV